MLSPFANNCLESGRKFNTMLTKITKIKIKHFQDKRTYLRLRNLNQILCPLTLLYSIKNHINACKINMILFYLYQVGERGKRIDQLCKKKVKTK